MENKQTILVAGATGNIGKAAVLALAKRGARVVLLGRSAEKLETKADSIHKALADDGIEYHVQDIQTLVINFADMRSVRMAAKEAHDRYPEINGLVLSVGALLQGGLNILPSGHEIMFATNVLGPFLFTHLLLKRLQESNGMVLHVIAPFHKKINWDDIESIKKFKTMLAFDRTKVYNRIFAGELARRYAGKISSVAFYPTYVIDKSDPELASRWPSGLNGFFWRMMTLLVAKQTWVAGEPIAELLLTNLNHHAINGGLFKLNKRIGADKAMKDEIAGKRLWNELTLKTGLVSQ